MAKKKVAKKKAAKKAKPLTQAERSAARAKALGGK
jgi:hypothetical protein